MRQLFIIIISLMAIFAFVPNTAHGADASVTDCTNFAGIGTISSAVATANTGGGIITFNCSGTIVFASELVINATVTINANGNTVIFDGGNTTTLFRASTGQSLTMDGFTFQNGFGGNSGAIAGDDLSTLTISNSTFTNNHATNVGGAIRADGTAIVSNSTFTNNVSDNYGGAIHGGGDDSILTISDSTFTTNSATNLRGGAINADNIFSVSNSDFIGNSAGEFGGGIRTEGDASTTISSSTFTNNTAPTGGAIYNEGGDTPTTVSGTSFTNNTCGLAATDFTNGGGNSVDVASINCPGVIPTPLNATAVCNGNDLEITITAGDAPFSISVTDSGGTMDVGGQPLGVYTYTGPDTFINIGVTEDSGDLQTVSLLNITCPSALPPAPLVEVEAPKAPVLGCALDTADGVEVANAPDNTYCRILMKNGGVVSYSGAIPADLIGLGVILAVDVYRLEGGASVNSFPAYAQVCLAGEGRLFYMDGRNAPRVSVELASELVDGFTCGWIPAPGTLILTN